MPSSRAVIPTRSTISACTSKATSPVVRVFLPDAEEVAVVDEQGHESELERVHDAGLFAGRLSNGSRRYQRARALRRATWSSWRIPIAFRRCCPISISICWPRARICISTRSSARIRWCSTASPGVAFAVFAPDRPARQRGRRFQFVGRPAPRHARARQRLLGNLRARTPGPATNTNTRSSGRTASMLPLKSDPVGFRRRGAAAAPLRSSSTWTRCRARARARRRQRAERADLDLRGASRLLAPPTRRRATAGSPTASSPSNCRPTRATSASPMSNSCR